MKNPLIAFVVVSVGICFGMYLYMWCQRLVQFLKGDRLKRPKRISILWGAYVYDTHPVPLKTVSENSDDLRQFQYPPSQKPITDDDSQH